MTSKQEVTKNDLTKDVPDLVCDMINLSQTT